LKEEVELRRRKIQPITPESPTVSPDRLGKASEIVAEDAERADASPPLGLGHRIGIGGQRSKDWTELPCHRQKPALSAKVVPPVEHGKIGEPERLHGVAGTWPAGRRQCSMPHAAAPLKTMQKDA